MVAVTGLFTLLVAVAVGGAVFMLGAGKVMGSHMVRWDRRLR